MTTTFVSRDAFYIDGQWQPPSSDRRFHLLNASTEEPIASVPEGLHADIDRAVAAARHAFDRSEWRHLSPGDRAQLLFRFADEFHKRASSAAEAVSAQNGMPIALSQNFEGVFPAAVMSYYAQLASSLGTEESRPSQMGRETIVSRSALGVVAAIIPWNFPVAIAVSKLAPALAAGCTVVVKPSPGTALDSYVLAEAAHAAGIPPGVINWVPADREVAAYLVSHPAIDKVAFTGSTAAGRMIAKACGELLRPVTLELGGKSAAIILDDADLDAVMRGLPMVSMFNNGQTCYSCSRVLAPRSRYRETIDAMAASFGSLAVGDALDPQTQIGPLASASHRDRVLGYIDKGKSEGRLVLGGGRPGQLSKGWFVEPTIFADVGNDAVISREEIFGPVLSVIPYTSEEEAIQLANDSPYGLGGSVWSVDEARARAVARQVSSGTIGINGYIPSIGSPFGGIKSSGLGNELGPEALDSYLRFKSTYIMG